MNTISESSSATAQLCLGSPRFTEARLAALSKTQGAASAWASAFERDGVASPLQAAGDFAVAIRDAAGRVFLAVDRFAIRTLCYRQDGGTLRFAERADTLVDASTAIDPQAIFDYLFFHNIPSPRTIFKDVYRVPPGHYVLCENGKITVAPYWVPTFNENHRESFESFRGTFLNILGEAVKTQLEGYQHQQIGCFLSGGTDSSTVAGLINKVSGQRTASYSIGFDAQGYDEMEYARIAARHFNTEHHEYYVTPADLVQGIPEVAGSYDQPFGNSSALPAFYCAKMAKADGVDKMLAGDGGDELFGGNTRYAKQRVFGWYDNIPKLVREGFLEPVLALPGMDHIPLIKKGVSYVEQARVPLPDRTEMYNLLLRLGPEKVLTADFLNRVDQSEPLRMQQETWRAAKADSQINRMLAFDWRYTLAENDLPKVCGTTKLANVEVGFPFLDDRLLEFSLGLPPGHKLKGLKLRWFFKEALRGFLPDAIITKKKHGFGLPFGVWVCTDQALRKLAEDTLASLAQRNIVEPAFLRSLVSDLLPAHPGYYGELVWILMMLEQWLQQHAPTFRA